MQKYLIALCLCAFSTLFVTSCSKENVINANKRIVKDIETSSGTVGSSIFNYTYDDQKRLIKREQFIDTAKQSTVTYDYSQANKVIEITQAPALGNIKLTTIYVLDASSKVIKYYSRDPTTNAEDTTKATTYLYNASNQVIEYVFPKNATTNAQKSVNTYANGNLVKQVNTLTDKNGVLLYTFDYTYEYNTTIVNTLDNEQYGQSFLPKRSQLAYSKLTYKGTQLINSVNETFTDVFDYTYDVDAEGNIIKKKEKATKTRNGNTYVSTKDITYTYQ
jgi:hypothetical protein